MLCKTLDTSFQHQPQEVFEAIDVAQINNSPTMPRKKLQAPKLLPPRPTHHNRAKSHPPVGSDVENVDEQDDAEGWDVESIDDSPDDAEIPATTKTPTPAPILAEYIINAKTMVGVQIVHQDYRATVEGGWSFRKYLEASALKVAEAAKTRGVEPILKSSRVAVYSTTTRPSPRSSRAVKEPDDWRTVEILVHRAAKSSKDIHVDFTMEYHARVVKYVDEEGDGSKSSEEDGPALIKRPRKVCSAHIHF